ncbi:MAG TPA: DUF3187 family protein [Fimbriimonadaceae bacterium]|nr:DUF3187 family protein [Fimbriimonadaceae bacterium]
MPFPLFACSILASWWFPVQGVGPTTVASVALSTHSEDGTVVGRGPISTRNGRVVCLPFMRFVPRDEFLGKGQSSLESSIQVINDVRRDPKDTHQPPVLFEDQETQRLSFLYSRGIGKGFEASVEVPFLARDGGFMDPIINWWHHTILPPQDRVRDNLPFGQCIVTIPGVGTFASANGVGDISFFLRKRLNSKVILAAGVKAPTGNAAELLGSGAFDGGLNLEYRTMIGRKIQLDVSAGFVGQGKPIVLKHARGLVDQESLAFTYLRNSRDAWVVQWQSEAAPVLTTPSADGGHRMLTFGYERRLAHDERLDLYFSEDHDLVPGAPLLVNIAPDFTIGIRITKRF